jgi:DNA-directed RNA polymerase sigma subunit (sigma70/sigma32)
LLNSHTPRKGLLITYAKQHREQIKVLLQTKKKANSFFASKKRNEFLEKYPDWDTLKLLIKPTQRELLEKVHCLNPDYYTLVDIAKEKGVSRQAVDSAHKKALKALEKALMKLD